MKYLHGTQSLLNIPTTFGIKGKSIILTHTMHYNTNVAIATNIPVQLKTAFVVQGHIYS